MIQNSKHFIRYRYILLGLIFANAVTSKCLAVSISEPAIIELGVIKPAATQTTKITIKNNNPVSLKVTAIDLECNECLKIDFKPTTIKPYEEAEFTVKFTSFPDDEGFIQKKIIFTTSDPLQKKIIVPVRCFVNPFGGPWPVVIQPVGNQEPGTDITITFDIVNVSDAPIKPLYASGPIDGPKLTLPKDPIAPGGRAAVTGKWHLPSKSGDITGQIIIYVDHPSLTKFTVPFQAVVSTKPVSLTSNTSLDFQPDSATSSANASAPQLTTMPAKNGMGVPAVSALPSSSSKAEIISKISSDKIKKEIKTATPQTIDLNLRDSLPLKDFVDIISSQLGLNLIYDEAALNGPISIKLSGPIPVDALLPLLKTILQSKNMALVPTERQEIWRIVTSREAQTLTEPGKINGPEQVVTEFIRPTNVDLETAAGLLRGFITPGLGQLTPVPTAKALIVTDYASQLARLHRLMELIDQPQPIATVEVVPLKAAEPGPLADKIHKLINQVSKAEGKNDFDKVFLSPSDDGSSLIVVGPSSQLNRITTLIQRFDTAPAQLRVDYPLTDQNRTGQLDTVRQILGASSSDLGKDGLPRMFIAPTRISILATEGQHRRIRELLGQSETLDGNGAVQLKAYRIQNRDAAEIYTTLTRLIGELHGAAINFESGNTRNFSQDRMSANSGIARIDNSMSSKEASPQDAQKSQIAQSPSSGNVNITVDQGTNTLLVNATSEMHKRVQTLINELDRRQAQVLLEVMLVSVADSNTFSAAVEAAVKASINGSTVGVGTDAGIGDGDFVTKRTPVEGSGFNGAILNPSSFSVFMRALEESNKAKVISTPQVLALDNKPALLRSIKQEPYTSINASNNVATTTLGGFAEAGTTLEMTPHIAPGDHLNVEYRLEVSSFTGSSSSAGIPPPKRSDTISSYVTVPDGSTVILGGLRSDSTSQSVAQVPGLGNIPIVGWIGKSQNNSNSKATFYVFVRPTILRANKFEDLKLLTQEPRDAIGVKTDLPVTILPFMK